MSSLSPRARLLRSRADGAHGKVEFVELFFDLVFVFAITQLSHGLLHHLTFGGALQTVFLLLATWWVWMYTTWVTNWLDPARIPVRFMMFALMFAGLVMSASIPKAFEDRGLFFALAYVAMQVGRSAFVVWCTRGHAPVRAENFTRITIWLATAGLFWIAGGLAEGSARWALWLVALGIEYAGPWAYFRVPGMGASRLDDWDVDAHHMAERCGLFVIIALGESVLVTGATFADLEWTGAYVSAFVAAFVGTIAMWWLYFSIGQGVATQRFAAASSVGSMARLAYTYFHIPIVAGIVFVAVGDELVLAHPKGHADLATILSVTGGAALYVAGTMLFKWSFFGRPPLSHLIALGALLLTGVLASALSPIALGWIVTVIIVVTALWEHASLKSLREDHAAAHH